MASPSTTARPVLLSEEEAQSIMSQAEECTLGECSVDDVADLIAELKEQQHLMEARLDSVMNTIAHLQHINQEHAHNEKKRDEVRALVKDLLRVFSTDKAAFPISGFSGDIPKKTLTAYDALSPKKFKKA